MAKTNDFVQLTKGYCKQNKTFLGNPTGTDYLVCAQTLLPSGGGRWAAAKLWAFSWTREPGWKARPSWSWLPRRPINRRGESQPFRRPIEHKWVRAPYQSRGEAGRARSRRRAAWMRRPRLAPAASRWSQSGRVPAAASLVSFRWVASRGGAGVLSANRRSGAVVRGGLVPT